MSDFLERGSIWEFKLIQSSESGLDIYDSLTLFSWSFGTYEKVNY